MIVGNARIVRCPHCGAEKALMSLVSGNTTRAVCWSDNKMIAPMLPHVSLVQKCPHCGRYYLHYKQKGEYGEYESFEKGELTFEEWKEAYLQFDHECAMLDKNDWANVRMGLIQAYNDMITGRCDVFPDGFGSEEPSKEEFVVSVINDFVREFDWSSVKNPLLKAELYREAGQFDDSMETLQSINIVDLDENERVIYDDIKARVKQKDLKVFRILSFHEKCAEEAVARRETAERAEQKWIEEQGKDPRWKVCENGHCFDNTLHSCKWCNGRNVVARVEKDSPCIDVVLYVGCRNGEWVLTTDSDIEGQSERIRKITIEMVGGYKLYYHIDGQNPNPFAYSDIRLGDKIISGRKLTEKCDQLIDEKLDELTLAI